MSPPDSHKLLILETSGRAGKVALAEGDRLIARADLDPGRRHARDLSPAVNRLLNQQRWLPSDVTAVLVSLGPGSYTGLRVGIISAKAFAYATGCAILGIDTLAAVALQAGSDGPVEVIVDAQQDRVYCQRFRSLSSTGLPHPETGLDVLSFDSWKQRRPADARVSGPGLVRFASRLPSNVPIVAAERWHPQPESLLRLGLIRLLAGQTDNVIALEPRYARPSSAEEKWLAQHGQGR